MVSQHDQADGHDRRRRRGPRGHVEDRLRGSAAARTSCARSRTSSSTASPSARCSTRPRCSTSCSSAPTRAFRSSTRPAPIAGATAPITHAGHIVPGRRRVALRRRHPPAARSGRAARSPAWAPTTSTWRTVAGAPTTRPSTTRATSATPRWPSGWTSPTGASPAPATRRAWTPTRAWRSPRSR